MLRKEEALLGQLEKIQGFSGNEGYLHLHIHNLCSILRLVCPKLCKKGGHIFTTP